MRPITALVWFIMLVGHAFLWVGAVTMTAILVNDRAPILYIGGGATVIVLLSFALYNHIHRTIGVEGADDGQSHV